MEGEESGEGEAWAVCERLLDGCSWKGRKNNRPSSPICRVLGTLGGCGAAPFAWPLVFSDFARDAGTGRAAKSLEPSSGLEGFEEEYRRCWRPFGLYGRLRAAAARGTDEAREDGGAAATTRRTDEGSMVVGAASRRSSAGCWTMR